MTMNSDPDGFLADFGLPVASGAVLTRGILDAPSNVISNGMVMTTDYQLTFKTSALPSLGYGSAITVGGVAYTVREVQAMDDGAFSVAYLSKP